MAASSQSRGARDLGGISVRDLLVTAGIAVPALTWTFLNFGMTLGFGHPTTDTKELPYVEVALQGFLALGVLIVLPNQSRFRWLVVLAPLPVWTLVRAVATDTSPLWAALLSVLLMSPILSVLMAGQTTERAARLLSVAFATIMAGQLLTFPFNLVGWLADDTAISLDRFSGTLVGRGGYFSSYVLLAGAFYLSITRARLWLKVVSFVVVLAYAWVAEVKLIFFVAGVVLGTVLIFSCTLRSAVWKIPAAALAAVMGMWLSLAIPSSYGLQMENYGYSIASPEQGISQLGSLIESTAETPPGHAETNLAPATATVEIEGSKIAATIATLWPASDLWSQSSHNAFLGVGPSGGLSHLARVADGSGLLPSASRPEPAFREEARALAGSRQRDQSLATQPESTFNGLISEVGYVGLVLFLASFVVAVWLSLRVFIRAAVAVFVGFAVAFLPLFSLWETPGFWMVIALGMAAVGIRPRLSPLPRNSTS